MTVGQESWRLTYTGCLEGPSGSLQTGALLEYASLPKPIDIHGLCPINMVGLCSLTAPRLCQIKNHFGQRPCEVCSDVATLRCFNSHMGTEGDSYAGRRLLEFLCLLRAFGFVASGSNSRVRVQAKVGQVVLVESFLQLACRV